LAAPLSLPHAFFHVAGVLVHAQPRDAREVGERIAAVEGAVVHAVDGAKLVVTLESEDARRILDALTFLQQMEGVLSAVLVSEQAEPLDAANEVIPHGLSPDPT
jgi:nitrate reductase NapD